LGAEPGRTARYDPAQPVADTASQAHREFEALARKAGMEPSDLWVGGYADYEWRHLRLLLQAYDLHPGGRDILEFGCNVGASSVVLAALGGRVTAVDISADAAAIARANLRRHGLDAAATVLHVADTRGLPFPSASFDMVLANSVLEYVEPEQLDAVLAELHRLLRSGGRMLICGTASRTAIREVHSRRWLVNYLPRGVDRLLGRSLQRGICPFQLAHGLSGRFEAIGRDRWLEARAAVHGRPSFAMRAVSRVAALLGISPGWFAPNIELLLEKRVEAGPDSGRRSG